MLPVLPMEVQVIYGSSHFYYFCLPTTTVLPVVEIDLVDCEVGSEVNRPPRPDLLVGVGTRDPPVTCTSNGSTGNLWISCTY